MKDEVNETHLLGRLPDQVLNAWQSSQDEHATEVIVVIGKWSPWLPRWFMQAESNLQISCSKIQTASSLYNQRTCILKMEEQISR